jgi:hypothetical protein
VVVALLQVNDRVEGFLRRNLDLHGAVTRLLGETGYQLLGVAAFAALALVLYRTARRSHGGARSQATQR